MHNIPNFVFLIFSYNLGLDRPDDTKIYSAEVQTAECKNLWSYFFTDFYRIRSAVTRCIIDRDKYSSSSECLLCHTCYGKQTDFLTRIYNCHDPHQSFVALHICNYFAFCKVYNSNNYECRPETISLETKSLWFCARQEIP